MSPEVGDRYRIWRYDATGLRAAALVTVERVETAWVLVRRDDGGAEWIEIGILTRGIWTERARDE